MVASAVYVSDDEILKKHKLVQWVVSKSTISTCSRKHLPITSIDRHFNLCFYNQCSFSAFDMCKSVLTHHITGTTCSCYYYYMVIISTLQSTYGTLVHGWPRTTEVQNWSNGCSYLTTYIHQTPINWWQTSSSCYSSVSNGVCSDRRCHQGRMFLMEVLMKT